VPVLAPAYLPRRPTETVLYGLVREHLESFLAHAREHYDDGLPPYVESELRAYLKCGVFSEGFSRAHCDSCGHDLLVAFSCHGRSICPSCCGRRMANTAAHLVDRILPDVPVRQYVLTLPYELRKLAAFKAEVLTALARIFVESVFATYRGRAKRAGIPAPQCGSVTFVQRFGSLNLHVHFHLVVLDGVFARDAQGRIAFHPAPPPEATDPEAIVERTARASVSWLRRRGYLVDSPLESRSNEPPVQTALDACAAIAMGRRTVATLRRGDDDGDGDDAHRDTEDRRAGPVLAFERHGFNVHAGVRIAEGDDLGRERLCRYGARPPMSLERLRRLPGGRVGYRLKYVDRGRREKHRVMAAMEFMARLAAIIAPPRYPLVRYSGVLAPRSAWRKHVVPRPRERVTACAETGKCAPEAVDNHSVQLGERGAEAAATRAAGPSPGGVVRMARPPAPKEEADCNAVPEAPPLPTAGTAVATPPGPGDVMYLAPNVVAVRHWNRLLGGLLYAVSPRVDWATLLRRSFQVDVLECPKCNGRLRVLAVITEREPVRRILASLGLPTDAPPVARARDPTDDVVDDRGDGQLSLGLG
jgi:hypothetical protein